MSFPEPALDFSGVGHHGVTCVALCLYLFAGVVWFLNAVVFVVLSLSGSSGNEFSGSGRGCGFG